MFFAVLNCVLGMILVDLMLSYIAGLCMRIFHCCRLCILCKVSNL